MKIRSARHSTDSVKPGAFSQPIYIIRRAQDLEERLGHPLLVIFIDWKRAFDSLLHHKLFADLLAMGLHINLIKQVQKNYATNDFTTQVRASKQANSLYKMVHSKSWNNNAAHSLLIFLSAS